ncbi:hypothetical protein CKF58_04980 [Psittacicella hinzii]|uniref:Uncharacterized protein n=1 Tax=Psittacicella hinzii TaxID=2028575 RepID=A0A3A1YJV4_9GAMM|nr:hypothetical protein CKF58_04980 [Psittacicella hinzii]
MFDNNKIKPLFIRYSYIENSRADQYKDKYLSDASFESSVFNNNALFLTPNEELSKCTSYGYLNEEDKTS